MQKASIRLLHPLQFYSLEQRIQNSFLVTMDCVTEIIITHFWATHSTK